MTDTPIKIRKTVRGKRPEFHDDGSIDRLIAMNLALASEVSALRDRVDTLERLGTAAGWLGASAVDNYSPTMDVKLIREARREEFVERIFHVLKEEVEDLQAGETSEAYWAKIAAIGET